MKKAILLLSISIGAYSTTDAQNEVRPPSTGAKIQFEKTVHDFGEILEGTQPSAVFVYQNVGTSPLILTNVQVTCGCMTPTWSREPLAPGDSGKIIITYNSSGRIGNFTKTTTVNHNADGERVYLTIKGVTIPQPVNPVPVKIPR